MDLVSFVLSCVVSLLTEILLAWIRKRLHINKSMTLKNAPVQMVVKFKSPYSIWCSQSTPALNLVPKHKIAPFTSAFNIYKRNEYSSVKYLCMYAYSMSWRGGVAYRRKRVWGGREVRWKVGRQGGRSSATDLGRDCCLPRPHPGARARARTSLNWYSRDANFDTYKQGSTQ